MSIKFKNINTFIKLSDKNNNHLNNYLIPVNVRIFNSSTRHKKSTCDPTDCSLLGSSVHGIFQARILRWVAIAFSRGSSWPRGQHRSPVLHADSLPTKLPGNSLRNQNLNQTKHANKLFLFRIKEKKIQK